MIPKIIHYCWLSDDPIPKEFRRYIEGWKRMLPDYEFMKWDFNRFPKDKSRWVSEAFDAKKYAFAADYIRCYALYNYGGIYMDMDVEVLKSFNPLLNLPYFFCLEKGSGAIEAAVIGAEKNSWIYRRMLDYYRDRRFINPDNQYDMRTLPVIITDVVAKDKTIQVMSDLSEFSDNPSIVNVFPAEWFSPIDIVDRSVHITPDTFSIHHFAGSWAPKKMRFKVAVKYVVGPKLTRSYIILKRNVKKLLGKTMKKGNRFRTSE